MLPSTQDNPAQVTQVQGASHDGTDQHGSSMAADNCAADLDTQSEPGETVLQRSVDSA